MEFDTSCFGKKTKNWRKRNFKVDSGWLPFLIIHFLLFLVKNCLNLNFIVCNKKHCFTTRKDCKCNGNLCSKEIHAEILFKNFIATVIILCKIQGCLSWFTATIKYQHFIFHIRIRPIQNASKYISYYSTCYHSNGS